MVATVQLATIDLNNNGIKYAWRGKVLGGFGKANDEIRTMLDKVGKFGEGNNCALMCSELNYVDCHRHWWLSRYLVVSKGTEVTALKTGDVRSVVKLKEYSFNNVPKDY